MKKYFLSLFCLLLVTGTLLSCKSNSVPFLPTTETNKSVVIKETVHDTVFKIEKDQSQYQALLECQNGKVLIKSPTEKQSKNGKLEPPKVKIVDNYIIVDCDLKEQELYAKWKSESRSELIETLKKIPIEIEKNMSTWETIQIYCGRIFLLLIALFLLGLFLKFKKII